MAVCIASQNFLQVSAAHRCNWLSIPAIPQPHWLSIPAIIGGVHFLAPQNANNDTVTNPPL